MGVSDENTTVPSFMRNPGWEELQEEIRAGQAGKRAEDAARLGEIKARVEAAEIGPGVSVLGTPASEEELFVLRRKFHILSLGWLTEKPLTAEEMSEIISLRSELGEKPFFDKSAFISLAEVKETERKREEGQLEIIRRLMKASKISFSPTSELPETSSLGGKLDGGEGTTFVLGSWFFGENPGYRQYFYGMLFNDAEKTQLVWLFDEVKPESFVSVAKLKEVLARKFGHGNGHEPHGTIGDRLPGVEDALLQGHPDRHAVGSGPKREAKARSRRRPEADDGDEFTAAGGRSRDRKK